MQTESENKHNSKASASTKKRERLGETLFFIEAAAIAINYNGNAFTGRVAIIFYTNAAGDKIRTMQFRDKSKFARFCRNVAGIRFFQG